MNIFYTPDITKPEYTLTETESKHCIRVLRMQNGDLIHLINGKGSFFEAEIVNAHPKRCLVSIRNEKPEFEKRNYYLHMAVAPTKNIDRYKWFLEKATEIGVDKITPLICFHSQRRQLNIEKLNLTITSAVKQSIKAYHPVLSNPVDFNTFIKTVNTDNKFITHCAEGEKQLLTDAYKTNQSALIMIGPEGDFSDLEIELAKKNGFNEISLGKSRLRTETAAIVACNTISIINQIA